MKIKFLKSASRLTASKDRAGRHQQRIVRYESLENRQLLAADTWEVASFDQPSNGEVASDLAGNAIVANSSSGQMSIRKFDTNGQPLWMTSFDGFQSGRVDAVEVMESGEIIVAGRFQGTIDFDPRSGQTMLASVETDGFVASFQDNGTSISLNWAHLIGDSVADVGLDSDSSITVVGSYDSAFYFDATLLLTSQTSYNSSSFVARLNSDGSLAWVRQIEDAGIFSASAVDVDTSGGVFISGRNASPNSDAINPNYPPLEVDGQVLPSGGGIDGYVLKFVEGPSDTLLDWFYHFGEGGGNEIASDIAISSENDLYILGRDAEAGDFDFAGTSYSNTFYETATVVAKVSLESGDPVTQWVHAIHPEPLTNSTVLPKDLELSENDAGGTTVFAAGYFAGTADFDPGQGARYLTSRNPPVGTLFSTTPEGFVVAIEESGEYSRAWQLGREAIDLSSAADDRIQIFGRHFEESPHFVTTSHFSDGSFVVGLNTE